MGTIRAETKALIGGGGGGGYSYIRVLPDEFLLKSTVMTTDFKRNSSGSLVSALGTMLIVLLTILNCLRIIN